MPQKKIVVIRDSRTGQFVPKGTEKTRPNTTEKETYTRKKR